MNLESRLTHVVTQYDIKQSTRKGYNPYALGQYLAMVDRICAAVADGAINPSRPLGVDDGTQTVENGREDAASIDAYISELVNNPNSKFYLHG